VHGVRDADRDPRRSATPGGNFELEALLFAGALTLVALGDGPLSVAVKLKHGS